MIERYNGSIIKQNRWGIRRLAYPIKKYTQGYYINLIFKADNKILSEMERFFRIEEPYIRYLTVRYEGEPVAEKESREPAVSTPKVTSSPEKKMASEEETEANIQPATEEEKPQDTEEPPSPEPSI